MSGVSGSRAQARTRAQDHLRLVPPTTVPGPEPALVRWAPWLVLGTGGVVGLLFLDRSTGQVEPAAVLVWTALLCATLVARLAYALVAGARRTSVAVMLTAVGLWIAGSAVLSVAGVASIVTFPAPGEGLFLLACVALAAFVFLDAQPPAGGRSAVAWADAAILCGAAAALAAAGLLTPLAQAYGEDGVGLLIAIVYPAIDSLIALMVVGQWALGLRPGDRRTLTLVGGLAVLAVADTSLLLSVPLERYSFTLVTDLLWGVAFALLVSAAVSRRAPGPAPSARRVPFPLLLTGFAVALLLLALRPVGPVGLAVTIAATVVLAAMGVRLLIALHDAQVAADALRLSAIDDLTGLPNRRALVARIEAGLGRAEPMGLLLCDVDGFREVNDALGHDAGDYLLRVVAERMGEVTPGGALLARMGSDEFAVVVGTADPIVLRELGSAIREVVAPPIGVDGLAVALRMSVGFAGRGTQDVVPVDLIRRADVAVRAAKEVGGGVETSHDTGDELSRERLELIQDLRAAVRQHRLTVWYQPIIRASSGDVACLEALVRWQDPERGMVPLSTFLPLARRYGLMLELTRQVTTQAIADLSLWRQSGLDVAVSINVAPAELLDGGVVAFVLERLAIEGVPPWYVTLEVTEEAFVGDPHRARQLIADARQAGLNTAIDDFGTGFSSLAYLRDLPVSEVKLDRTFLAAVVTDPRSAVIVQSAVSMSHALGMRVVAEGVETSAVAARAITLGVDALQGFYLTRPMPADDVPAFVTSLAIDPTP